MRRLALLTLVPALLIAAPVTAQDDEDGPTAAATAGLMQDFFALCWTEQSPEALKAVASARGWSAVKDEMVVSATGGPLSWLLNFEKSVEGQNTGISVRQVGAPGQGFEACGLVAPGFSGQAMAEQMAAKVGLPPNDSDREGPAWTLAAHPDGGLTPVDPAATPAPGDRGLSLGVTVSPGFVGVVAVHTPRPRKPGEREDEA